jgi:hypothetical protein
VYRAFMLDRTDHVFAVRILVTREDNAALRLASKIQAPCWGIEVWEGTRLTMLVTARMAGRTWAEALKMLQEATTFPG